MSLIEWAADELDRAGLKETGEDGPNEWMREGVLELLRVFISQGHSGSSAPFAIGLFEKLASWRPLTPLTGDADEWQEVGPSVWQNKRSPNVFKEGDGRAYNLDGIVFWEWYTDEETGEKSKSYFTNRDSRVFIDFPYTVPDKPEYRERPEQNKPKT